MRVNCRSTSSVRSETVALVRGKIWDAEAHIMALERLAAAVISLGKTGSKDDHCCYGSFFSEKGKPEPFLKRSRFPSTLIYEAIHS